MPQPLIKRIDQLAIGSFAAIAILSMIVWLAAHHWRGSNLVNIEHAAPLRYQFLVDVNQADWPELAQLPGVGEVLARRIVELRAQGQYRTSDDLLQVQGIGPRKLAQMQRYLVPLPEDQALVEAGNPPHPAGS